MGIPDITAATERPIGWQLENDPLAVVRMYAHETSQMFAGLYIVAITSPTWQRLTGEDKGRTAEERRAFAGTLLGTPELFLREELPKIRPDHLTVADLILLPASLLGLKQFEFEADLKAGRLSPANYEKMMAGLCAESYGLFGRIFKGLGLAEDEVCRPVLEFWEEKYGGVVNVVSARFAGSIVGESLKFFQIMDFERPLTERVARYGMAISFLTSLVRRLLNGSLKEDGDQIKEAEDTLRQLFS